MFISSGKQAVAIIASVAGAVLILVISAGLLMEHFEGHRFLVSAILSVIAVLVFILGGFSTGSRYTFKH